MINSIPIDMTEFDSINLIKPIPIDLSKKMKSKFLPLIKEIELSNNQNKINNFNK